MIQGLFLDTCAKRVALAVLSLSAGIVGMLEQVHAMTGCAQSQLVHVGTQQAPGSAFRAVDEQAGRDCPGGQRAQRNLGADRSTGLH